MVVDTRSGRRWLVVRGTRVAWTAGRGVVRAGSAGRGGRRAVPVQLAPAGDSGLHRSRSGPALAPHPPPQATTDELRARLAPMLRPDQRSIVSRWCAWADDVLACRGDPVFVHGDLHGYNQVWDQQQLRLRLVADFETSGTAEAEYDFRYIPALGPGVILLISAAKHYSQRTGSPLNLDHVMAWHLRSYLGEALWRSEAGLHFSSPPRRRDALRLCGSAQRALRHASDRDLTIRSNTPAARRQAPQPAACLQANAAKVVPLQAVTPTPNRHPVGPAQAVRVGPTQTVLTTRQHENQQLRGNPAQQPTPGHYQVTGSGQHALFDSEGPHGWVICAGAAAARLVDVSRSVNAEWANKAAAVREPRPRGHSATVSSLITHSG